MLIRATNKKALVEIKQMERYANKYGRKVAERLTMIKRTDWPLKSENKYIWAKIKEEYDDVRSDYFDSLKERRFITLADSRKRKLNIDWVHFKPCKKI